MSQQRGGDLTQALDHPRATGGDVVVHLVEAQRGDGIDAYRSIVVEGYVLGGLSAGFGGTPSPEEITTAVSSLGVSYWRDVDLNESEML